MTHRAVILLAFLLKLTPWMTLTTRSIATQALSQSPIESKFRDMNSIIVQLIDRKLRLV